MKKQRQQKSRQNAGTRTRGEVDYAGKELLVTTVPTTTGTLTTLSNIIDASTSVLGTMATTFGLYRFNRLSIRLLPQQGNLTAGYLTVGYSNEITDQNPSAFTTSSIATMPYSIVQTSGTTVPLDINVPRSFLVGGNALKFWRTTASILTPSSSTAWENTQGELYFKTASYAASAQVILLISYSVTFSEPQSTVTLPLPCPCPSCNELEKDQKNARSTYGCQLIHRPLKPLN
jgi:hypothetical protein